MKRYVILVTTKDGRTLTYITEHLSTVERLVVGMRDLDHIAQTVVVDTTIRTISYPSEPRDLDV